VRGEKMEGMVVEGERLLNQSVGKAAYGTIPFQELPFWIRFEGRKGKNCHRLVSIRKMISPSQDRHHNVKH